MMNRRLTLISRARKAVAHAMMIANFGDGILLHNLRAADRWLLAAKKCTLGGNTHRAEVSLTYANDFLELVMGRINEIA